MYAMVKFYDDYTREEIPNTSIYGKVYGRIITESYDYGENEEDDEIRDSVVELTIGDER